MYSTDTVCVLSCTLAVWIDGKVCFFTATAAHILQATDSYSRRELWIAASSCSSLLITNGLSEPCSVLSTAIIVWKYSVGLVWLLFLKAKRWADKKLQLEACEMSRSSSPKGQSSWELNTWWLGECFCLASLMGSAGVWGFFMIYFFQGEAVLECCCYFLSWQGGQKEGEVLLGVAASVLSWKCVCCNR